jgi:hypothetical protein
MKPVNRERWMRVVAACIALFACGYCVPPGFAGQGDSPLEAYFLPYNTETKGTIGAENKPDYYYVVVPATGRLVIRLYDIVLQDLADGLDISLFRMTQNSVGSPYPTYWNYVATSKNTSITPDIIDIPNLPRGIYFVQVSPQPSWVWDGATYKIRAEYTVFPPVVADDIGDKREYALPIVNQLPTRCTLSGTKDVDWFECQVPYNTNLTLSLTEIGPGGNVDLEVYTAWDVKIGSATKAGNANELLYLPDLVPGQYFIKIVGEGTPQYTFTAKQEFARATDILDDVGNDLAHAMPLLPGNPSIFCLQPYTTDNDFFSIYQPQDGVLIVDVFNIFLWDGADDLYVQVLDEYGNAVAQSDNAPRIPEHIEVNLSRGQYFIVVWGKPSWVFDGAVYTINVKTAGQDVGDAFSEAMQIHAIPYGSETYGYPYIGMIDRPGDMDFFQVVLKDTGFIYLKVDRMLYANVDVQLFDAEHNLLQTSANPGIEPNEAIYVDGLDAGVYFIKVYSPDGGTGQYRLTPTVITQTSTISDDIGNDMSRAFPLVPYRRVNGYVWNDNTSDYFKFTLATANKLVRIHVNNVHMWDKADDIKLCIFNGSGTQIKCSDNAVLQDEIVELRDLEAGTYYASLMPKASWVMDPAQYCIVVETDAAPLPSATLHIPVDIQGGPGAIIYAPVVLDNTQPDLISSMSIGVQFDPAILEPMGVSNAGLTLAQGDAQVRYARSTNTISASMDNFSTVQSGDLLKLIFQIKPGVPAGSVSVLTVIASILNGAVVPATDGLATVSP